MPRGSSGTAVPGGRSGGHADGMWSLGHGTVEEPAGVWNRLVALGTVDVLVATLGLLGVLGLIVYLGRRR